MSGFSSDTDQGGRFGVSGFFNQAVSRVGRIVKAAMRQATHLQQLQSWSSLTTNTPSTFARPVSSETKRCLQFVTPRSCDLNGCRWVWSRRRPVGFCIPWQSKQIPGQAPARDSDTFAEDYDELPRQLTEGAGVSCKMLNATLKDLEVGGKKYGGNAPKTAEKSLVAILQIIAQK